MKRNRFDFFSSRDNENDPYLSKFPYYLTLQDKCRLANCNLCVCLFGAARRSFRPDLDTQEYEQQLISIALFLNEYGKYKARRINEGANRLIWYPLQTTSLSRQFYPAMRIDYVMKPKLAREMAKLNILERKMKRKVWDLDRNFELSKAVHEMIRAKGNWT